MAFRYAEIGDVPATRGDDLSDPLRHRDVRRRVLTSLCAVNILCTHFCTLLPANQLSVHAYGRGNSAYAIHATKATNPVHTRLSMQELP